MQCPVDGTELLMTHRNDIEIDYCPKCRGIWLDRGELDKIIERSAKHSSAYDRDDDRDDRRYYDDDDKRPYPYPQKQKRKSFLDDLFDF